MSEAGVLRGKGGLESIEGRHGSVMGAQERSSVMVGGMRPCDINSGKSTERV